MPTKQKRSILIPAYIPKTLQILERISPSLAAKAGLYLFLKPMKFPIPKREMAIREKGEMIIKRLSNGLEYRVFTYGSSDKKIILLHGWLGRSSQFYTLIPELVKQGYEVHSVDAPAHGEAKGNTSNLLMFKETVSQLEKDMGPYQFGIGHSLGSIALISASAQMKAFEKLVIIGTPSKIERLIDNFCSLMGLSSRVNKRITELLENRFGYKADDFSPYYTVRNIEQEGLIIHDTDDVDVAVESAYEINEHWTNSKTLITKGLGHRRVLSDVKVSASILDFFKG